ncbi:10260_t:CDS:1, partial [Ambispora leptoticha]
MANKTSSALSECIIDNNEVQFKTADSLEDLTKFENTDSRKQLFKIDV